MTLVSESARAKVNLNLHLVRRREDGFHLIESLVAFAQVADRLDVEPARRFELSVTGPFADALASCPDEENLVVQAGVALSHGVGGVLPGAAIMLEKNLPVAAGLGGGSADAAACIRALLALNRAKPGPVALAQIGASLGADVNVCLASQPAIITGVGNVVEPVHRLAEVHAVLVNPGVALSTAEVYQAAGLLPGEAYPAGLPARPAHALGSVDDLIAYLLTTRNDLEGPAKRLAPVVAEVEAALSASPGCLLARMSGSGPTCFGLFGSAGEAHDAAQWLADGRPDWWVRATTVG